eukprot:1185720-Prorocentrum_minimum.AAC.2
MSPAKHSIAMRTLLHRVRTAPAAGAREGQGSHQHHVSPWARNAELPDGASVHAAGASKST